jgi:hypothetical protein
MAKHRAVRVPGWSPVLAAVLAAVAVVAAVLVAVVLRGAGAERGTGTGTGTGARPAAGPGAAPDAAPDAATDRGCTALRVTTASSYRPVLDALKPALAAGPDCVALAVTTADGRTAGDAAADATADVWIPDDGAWAATAGRLRVAEDRADAGTVVAASPLLMVGDAATAGRVAAAGGRWLDLAALVGDGTVRLAVRDPAGSGDGLLGAGAPAEAVWLEEGMDPSALWLSRAKQRTRTVPGDAAALPAGAGEIGLVPEYALLTAAQPVAGLRALPGADHAAVLRYTWLPSAAAAADPARAAGLRRLLADLTGPGAAPALAAAGLRTSALAPPPPAAGFTPPELTAKPLETLGGHHVDHVFATWYPADRRSDLLMVVDVSGSMREPAPGTRTPLIDLVKRGAGSVVGVLPDDARMGLWEFGVALGGDVDHRTLVPQGELAPARRAELGRAVDALAARRTGTGLYDTILAAYLSGRDGHRAGVPNHVFVFTDGRNEDDPGGLTADALRRRLAAAQDPARPVQLSVVVFGGGRREADVVRRATEPVDGYVDTPATPDEVEAVFIHVAAGGLHA